MTATTARQPNGAADLAAHADGLLAEAADRWERTGSIPRSELAGLAGAGLFGLTIPVMYGGSGLPLTDVADVHAAVAGRSPSLHSIVVVHSMVCHALVRWATPALRERFLPKLAAGQMMAAFALTEAGSGSDIRALGTTVTPTDEGDTLVVDGCKRWISNGLGADLYLVFGHDAGAGRAVLVPPGAGVTAVPEPETTGLRAARASEIRFDSARVSADLGVSRPGFAVPHVATSCLTHGRLLVAAGAIGVARAALHIATGQAAHRIIGGSVLGERQLVRAALADSAILIDGAAALLATTSRAVEERASDAPIRAAKVKLLASRAAQAATDHAARLLGAHGMVAEHQVTRLLAAARTYQVIEGPTEVLLDLIGAALVRGRQAVSGTGEAGP
jgi:alkylation response protein AidB-like acyl-CoA dehydrogenase